MSARANTLLLSGLWFSILALLVGGSLLLPPTPSANERSLALLYKFASADRLAPPAKQAHSGRSAIADLDTMLLSLYEDGKLIHSYPILSKGKPGTPWETPTGRYVVQTKERMHFSTIGHTWMPYSMQFYGNFFVHGWPTYENGDPVPVGYSGGCIRLSTQDAKDVFEFLPLRAPLYVEGAGVVTQFATSSRYYLRGDGEAPDVSATSFLIADADTGVLLWERNSGARLSPGGLTALMTALTSVEAVNQYKTVRVSELLLGRGALRKHKIGEVDKIPLGVLVYPLLYGGNDTAGKLFATVLGVRPFVSSMNQKARAVGMQETEFSGPESIDHATTTARDLYALLAHVRQSKRFLLDVTLSPRKEYVGESGEAYSWENRNPWVTGGDAMFRGGLIATDDAGRGGALLLFELPLSEFGTRTVAFVVLDATHLEEDILALRTFVTKHFVFGVEREGGEFFEEQNEEPQHILDKARSLLELDRTMRSSPTGV